MSKPTILVLTIILSGTLGVVIGFFRQSIGNSDSTVELTTVSCSRNLADQRNVYVQVNVVNNTEQSVTILGISRTDCGFGSVSEDPPFHLKARQNCLVNLQNCEQ